MAQKPSHFGENLRRIRKTKGLDQDALAAASGVPQGTISNIERGRQKSAQAETIAALAQGLGVTTDELLGLEGGKAGGPVSDPRMGALVHSILAELRPILGAFSQAAAGRLARGLPGMLGAEAVEDPGKARKWAVDILRGAAEEVLERPAAYGVDAELAEALKGLKAEERQRVVEYARRLGKGRRSKK